MDGNRKSQMKRLRKGRKNVISHREGRETETDRWTREGGKRGGRCLTVAGSCTVSVLVGNHLCPLAPLSGPEYQLLLNGVHLASPSHCSPASYTRQDTYSYDTENKYRLNVNISVFGHKGYNAYTNLKIKKTHSCTHTHTCIMEYFSLSPTGGECALREQVISRCDSIMTLALKNAPVPVHERSPDNLVK